MGSGLDDGSGLRMIKFIWLIFGPIYVVSRVVRLLEERVFEWLSQVMVFSMQLYIFVKISEGISQKEHKNIRHCLNLGCLPPGIFGHLKVFQKIWRTKNFLIKKNVLLSSKHR